ncbi:HAD family hydrolase [Micromonospora rubida]
MPDGTGYAALIFDWDGTLVHSRELNFRALSAAMREHGALLDPGWYWPRQAISVPDLLVLWERQFGPLSAPVNVITDRFRAYVVEAAPSLVVNAAVADVARAAAARGQKLAIGSNASTASITVGLAATGLSPLFPVVVTRSDVTRGKPAPEIYALAARRLGVDAGDCLVYEDAEEGVASAQAAGMAAYNISTGALVPRPRAAPPGPTLRQVPEA